jgi:hypothetical protein
VKHRRGTYGLGVLLAMTVGCNRGTRAQPTNGVAPASSASAVTTTGSYEVIAIMDGGAIGNDHPVGSDPEITAPEDY